MSGALGTGGLQPHGRGRRSRLLRPSDLDCSRHDPAFLYKLAFSWVYAVPPGTPDRPISAAQLPATGLYLTKSLLPGHTWVLVGNPLFRPWSQQAQPDGYPGPDRPAA